MYIVNGDEINTLRKQREIDCFSIINRGKFWYDMLTPSQQVELKEWYKKWLDVTETKTIPNKPEWLNDKLKSEEITW